MTGLTDPAEMGARWARLMFIIYMSVGSFDSNFDSSKLGGGVARLSFFGVSFLLVIWLDLWALAVWLKQTGFSEGGPQTVINQVSLGDQSRISQDRAYHI